MFYQQPAAHFPSNAARAPLSQKNALVVQHRPNRAHFEHLEQSSWLPPRRTNTINNLPPTTRQNHPPSTSALPRASFHNISSLLLWHYSPGLRCRTDNCSCKGWRWDTDDNSDEIKPTCTAQHDLLEEVRKWDCKLAEIGGQEEYQRASQMNTNLFSTIK